MTLAESELGKRFSWWASSPQKKKKKQTASIEKQNKTTLSCLSLRSGGWVLVLSFYEWYAQQNSRGSSIDKNSNQYSKEVLRGILLRLEAL